MFTGIVEELGRVRDRAPSGDGGRLTFEARVVTDDAKVGDSISVNGCCLTVVEVGQGWWQADVVAESLRRTNLGDLQRGDAVNLERPVRLADRLGGHLVQGHVDAVGEIVQPVPDLHIRMPGELARYIVETGSATGRGWSLAGRAALEGGLDGAGS